MQMRAFVFEAHKTQQTHEKHTHTHIHLHTIESKQTDNTTMASLRTHRHPPLAAYYNRHEFVPTSSTSPPVATTLYQSAYHRTAPSQQATFRHEQPSVWYQKKLANTNEIVQEYAEPQVETTVLAEVVPVVTFPITEPVVPASTPVTPPMTDAQYRRFFHFPQLLVHHDKNTVVPQQQPPHHFIRWPHWSVLNQQHNLNESSSSSSSSTQDAPHHRWTLRHAHSVGAGAA